MSTRMWVIFYMPTRVTILIKSDQTPCLLLYVQRQHERWPPFLDCDSLTCKRLLQATFSRQPRRDSHSKRIDRNSWNGRSGFGWSWRGHLVSRPIYGQFKLDFGNTDNLKIVYADMKGVNSFSSAIVARYQEALDSSVAKGIKVAALLIINPHNPLGR